MAITLGKDATLNVNGAVTGVTNVTWTETARTIDIEEYGVRTSAVYQTGYDITLSFQVNNNTSVLSLIAALQNGTQVTVSGGSGGWSLPAVLTSISETDPLDGVVTFQVEAKITRAGLR